MSGLENIRTSAAARASARGPGMPGAAPRGAGVPVRSGAPDRRIRNSALVLTLLALAFYFGFIAITLYRSHH